MSLISFHRIFSEFVRLLMVVLLGLCVVAVGPGRILLVLGCVLMFASVEVMYMSGEIVGAMCMSAEMVGAMYRSGMTAAVMCGSGVSVEILVWVLVMFEIVETQVGVQLREDSALSESGSSPL